MQKRRRGRPSLKTASSRNLTGNQGQEQGQRKSQSPYRPQPPALSEDQRIGAQRYNSIHQDIQPQGALGHNTATTAAASPILPATAGSLPSPPAALPSTPPSMAPASTPQTGGGGGGGRKRPTLNTPSHSPASKKPKTEDPLQRNSYRQSPSPPRQLYPDRTATIASSTNSITALEPPVHGPSFTGINTSMHRPSSLDHQPPVTFPTPGNGIQSHSPLTPQMPDPQYSQSTDRAPVTSLSPTQPPPPPPPPSNPDLPPHPRLRPDGKGRDPYNIETICAALNIPVSVWDQKLRPELGAVIKKYGLEGQKVIPSNSHSRDQAVEEWIRNCPEWLHERNEAWRKVYAMDRLKCGMADIRRSGGPNNPRPKQPPKQPRQPKPKPNEVPRDEARESDTTSNRERSDSLNVQQPPIQPLMNSPGVSQPHSIGNPPPPSSRHGHMHNATIDAPHEPSQHQPHHPHGQSPPPPPPHQSLHPLPSGAQSNAQYHHHHPGSYTTGYAPPPPPISPEEVSLTIDAVSAITRDRRTLLTAADFMPNGHYSLAHVEGYVSEDLGTSLHEWSLWYDGPHGKVNIHNDRGLRNAVMYEASRGNRYPKWELKPRAETHVPSQGQR